MKTRIFNRYNWRSLGIKKIRKVQMSRGGKEGNNALTKVNELPDRHIIEIFPF